MNLFSEVLSAVYGLFSYEFTIYGISLSFLQVIIWTVVASLVLSFVWRLLN